MEESSTTGSIRSNEFPVIADKIAGGCGGTIPEGWIGFRIIDADRETWRVWRYFEGIDEAEELKQSVKSQRVHLIRLSRQMD